MFFSIADRESYLTFIRDAAESFGVTFWAWCLMPNHVHFIVVPKNESSLASCFGAAHTKYSRMINFRKNWRGFMWQGRFSSCPMDDEHARHAVRYVENNPVRARMTENPWDYPWSSASYHVGTKTHDPLNVLPVSAWDISGDWRGYLSSGEASDIMGNIRKETNTGRPLGSSSFVKRLENKIGRILKRGKPGRPRKRKGNR